MLREIQILECDGCGQEIKPGKLYLAFTARREKATCTSNFHICAKCSLDTLEGIFGRLQIPEKESPDPDSPAGQEER